MKLFNFRSMTYTRMIAMSFIGLILIGSLLLSLPVSSAEGNATPYVDALFTASSAVCVTGLVVYDTFAHWSLFGKLVILALIQIGGLGFMMTISTFVIFTRKRISLRERKILMESSGTMRLDGVIALVKRIILGTFLVELLGAICLAIRFCPQMGLGTGLFYSVFHSISAFCNAGFDIMGSFGEFSSMTRYSADVLVNVVLMLLIVVGGIGFIVWEDILQNKHHLRKYSLHSKIVLTTTAILLAGGMLMFFLFEYNASMAGMNMSERLLCSAFQSVSPRTAGMNTIDLTALSNGGLILTLILMFIGGSPGSTAGGIKTTTFAVLIIGALTVSRNDNTAEAFKKRIDDNTVRRACAVFVLYILAFLIAVMVLGTIEPFSLKEIVFEVVSALGTVGLSLGITPHLGTAAKIIIAFLMFMGRVGGLSLMLVLSEKKKPARLERPVGKLLIG